jgi:hypothetical protein
MLEAVTLPGVVVGFVLCIVLQWLWAAFWLSQAALRAMRWRKVADCLYWIGIAALWLGGAWFAVMAMNEALQLMALNIRGRY